MIDLTRNRYSSQHRMENAAYSYSQFESKVVELQSELERLVDEGKIEKASSVFKEKARKLRDLIQALDKPKDRDEAKKDLDYLAKIIGNKMAR